MTAAVLYNPALLDRWSCRAEAVFRRGLFERVLADLQRAPDDAAPQHRLFVGPTGAGKTMLLRCLGHAIEDDPQLSELWVPLTFPERQYDVDQPADLWTNALDYLVVRLTRGHQHALAAALRGALSELPSEPQRRNREAYELLVSASQLIDRRFVLLIDNLDALLERLERFAPTAWGVRQRLASEPRLVIVGASTRPPTFQANAVFYDLFMVHPLRHLAGEVVGRAIASFAPEPLQDRIVELCEDNQATLSALLDLTGSQPRELALVSLQLTLGGVRPARVLLAAVLDLLTPQYRAAVDLLGPPLQRVLHALGTAWHPIAVDQIAVRLRAKDVSGELEALKALGLIERVDYDAGPPRYHIVERLFATWFMLRSGQPHRRTLLSAVDLLELAYRDPRPPVDPRLIDGARACASGHWRAAAGLARRCLDDTAWPDWGSALYFLRAAIDAGRELELIEELSGYDHRLRWELVRHALPLCGQPDRHGLRLLAPELRPGVLHLVRLLTAPPGAIRIGNRRRPSQRLAASAGISHG